MIRLYVHLVEDVVLLICAWSGASTSEGFWVGDVHTSIVLTCAAGGDGGLCCGSVRLSVAVYA